LIIFTCFSWLQDSFVQAEYWHDPIKESNYIEGSYFLADINNERTNNSKYRGNLLKLKNFVMVMFSNDTMVIPKESAWFAFYSPGQDKEILPLEKSVLYLTVSNFKFYKLQALKSVLFKYNKLKNYFMSLYNDMNI